MNAKLRALSKLSRRELALELRARGVDLTADQIILRGTVLDMWESDPLTVLAMALGHEKRITENARESLPCP